jgi:hypothetical protein
MRQATRDDVERDALCRHRHMHHTIVRLALHAHQLTGALSAVDQRVADVAVLKHRRRLDLVPILLCERVDLLLLAALLAHFLLIFAT